MSGQEAQMNQHMQYSTVILDSESKRSPVIGNEEAWLAANISSKPWPRPQNFHTTAASFKVVGPSFQETET